MNAISSHINSRRTAIGIPMIRGAVMAGIFASTILTALPSVTFARDNNGDNNGKHSLVQQPYGLKTKSPFASTFQTIDTLQASRDALTADMAALKAQVDQLTTDNTKLRQDLTATTIALNAAKADISTVSSKVVTLETKAVDIIPGLATYLKIDKTTVLQGVNGPHILITGANVHVRSGSEATDNNAAPYTGLGNLIIGYNENTMPTPTLVRTGSHNLVGGSMHSFSSYGGMVFGYQNMISGPYANVVGGSVNLAQGTNSTVYGSTSQKTVNMNSYAPIQSGPPTGGGR